MTYTLKQVVGYKWAFSMHGATGWGWGYAWVWKGQGPRHLHRITADLLPSFLYFMMNAHSMPESIR
jgi:hypothetical protein